MAAWFEFAPLPAEVTVAIGVLVCLYLVAAELMKRMAVLPPSSQRSLPRPHNSADMMGGPAS
jgi:hypothetical protein